MLLISHSISLTLFQVCGDVVNPFSLDTNLAMAMQDSLCSTDYIVISSKTI